MQAFASNDSISSSYVIRLSLVDKHTFAKLFVHWPIANTTLDTTIVGEVTDTAADGHKPSTASSRAIF